MWLCAKVLASKFYFCCESFWLVFFFFLEPIFVTMLLSNFLNLSFNLLDGEGMCFVLTIKSYNFFLTTLKIVEISTLETYTAVGSVSVFI